MWIYGHSGTQVVTDREIIKVIDSIKDVKGIIEYMGGEYSSRVRMFAKSKAIVMMNKLPRGERVEVINRMIDMFEYTTDTWLQRNILEVASHFYNRELEEFFLSYARNGKCSEYVKDRILTLYDPVYRRNRNAF